MQYRGVVLDVDGTVVRGETAIPGALDGLAAIAEHGAKRIFVSNNPVKAPPAYEERLARAGIEVDASDIITSGTATTSYLVSNHADDRVFCVGEPGLCDQLRDAGLELVGAGEHPDVVVVGIDRDFHYDDLRDAHYALRDGALFYGTDPDIIIPTDEGDIPGSGAIIRAVAGIADRDPDAILGKPSPVTQGLILDMLGVAPEDILVVGDRLDTDIALGIDAGMDTALVKTGVTDDETLAQSEYTPTHVLDSLGELRTLLVE